MPGGGTGGYSPPAVSDSVPIGPPVVAGGPPAGQYAEFMPRVGAAFLDGLFLMLVGGIPVIAIAFAGGFALAAAGTNPDSPILILFQVFAQAVGLLAAAAYFILLDSSQKQGTWGKQIMGIRVTDLEGRRVSIGRATARFFAKCFLSNCTCGIAFLMPLFTEKKQTLHDMICGCLTLKQ